MMETTGARESNAGDDFHFIWVAKRTLKLFEPNTEFSAITVEGPSEEECMIFEDDDTPILSIDIAEYYGGKNIIDANKVVFSQLKYSTRHGNQSWTLSKLSAATNTKENNSVIRRLADTYKGYLKKYPDSIHKLSLKLVSNRDIEENFKSSIYKWKNLIEVKKYGMYMQLKKELLEEEKALIKEFYDESKLNASEFIGFIKCLDLSDCGTGIRDIQDIEVIQNMNDLGICNIQEGYDKLLQFIRKQMLPEKNRKEPITKDRLAGFFSTVPIGLFPASPHIVLPKNYITRSITKELIDKILDNENNYICLHATGGMGKTSLLAAIEEKLPNGSTVIVYDCFGGGNYMNSATHLHLYKYAITQICNEMAMKCYSNFIIPNRIDDDDYLRLFSDRVYQASQYLNKINEQAILLIVLDALDNSIFAAEHFQSKCFSERLFQVTLPSNVKILITTRTERKESLKLPLGTKEIELKGFDVDEEKKFLECYFENAASDQVEEIINLTDGNPRVQNYLLTAKVKTLVEFVECLKPNGKNLEGIFEEAIKEIDKRAESSYMSFQELCQVIVELPRPIPLELIIATTNYDINALSSICAEYLIGVYISEEKLTFRDEDFEYYLTKLNGKQKSVYEKIANILLEHCKSDYYATKYLHLFLQKANYLSELLDSIYNISEVTIPLSNDDKNQILTQRISSVLDMDEIYQDIYRLDVEKILYILAKCNAIQSNAKDFVIDNITLLQALGFSDSIYRIISENKSYKSLKEVTFSLYVNTMLGKMGIADEYFSAAVTKVKEYLNKKEKEERFNDRISTKDIFYISYYIAIKSGARSAISYLDSWTPYPAEEYYSLTYNLLLTGKVELARELIVNANHIDMFAAIICASRKTNYILEREVYDKIENLVISENKEKKLREKDYKYRIELMEVLITLSKEDLARKIGGSIEITFDGTYISFYKMNGELSKEYYFNLYAMKIFLYNRKYGFQDFLESNHIVIKDNNKEKSNELKKIVDFLMPSFSLYVKNLESNSNVKMEDFEIEHSNRLKGEYSFYNDHNAYDYYRIIEKNIVAILVKSEKRVLKQWCEKYLEDKFLNNEFQFNLIEQIIMNGRNVDVAAGHLIALEKRMLKNPVAAYEMKEFYIRCAQVSYLFSKGKSREYIEKAFDVMSDVDEEAYRRIDVFEKLSRKYDSAAEDKGLAYNFARVIEDSYRKLDDAKHLPQDSIFKLLCNIHPSSAIAAACRWEDRDDEYVVLGYEISIPNVLINLLGKGVCSADVVVSLSNIDILSGNRHNEIVETLLKNIDDSTSEQQKKIIKIIVDNIETMTSGFAGSYDIGKISNWCEGKVHGEHAETFKRYKFIDEHSCAGYKTNNYENKRIPWKQIKKEEIIFDYKSLNGVMEKLEDTDVTNLIDHIFENTRYEKQIAMIKLLVNLVISGCYKWYSFEVRNKLFENFDEWEEYNTDVKECRRDRKYISEVIDELQVQSEYSKEKIFPFILQLFKDENEYIYSLYQKQAIMYLKEEPWKIYSFLGDLAILENSENCKEFLKWCCEEELKWVHLKSGDEKFSHEKINNYSIDESFAIYISKMLGHAEKDKRWYAMHSLYDLFLLGNIGLIELVIETTQSEIPDVYRDCDYVFFKDAAKTSLLMVLRKISVFKPIFLQKYLEEFRTEVMTKTPMNILHRELLRQIIMNFRPDDNDVKRACDLVRSDKVPHSRLYRGRKEVGTKFRFDSLDVVPKTYQFLGDIFQKSDWEVAKYCDRWIENWGYTNDNVEHWNNRLKTQNYYAKTYGGDTAVEDLSKYLQFNSMFYVADQLRMEVPSDDDESPIYTFDEWMKSWLAKYENNWIADIKTIVPCIEYLMDTKRYVKDGKYVIENNIFDQALKGEDDTVILDMDNTIEYAKSNKRYSISVAFIDEVDLPKLKRSVTQKNYHIKWDYMDDDKYEDSDWEDEGFMSCSIDYYNDSHDNSQEKYDPYLQDMSSSFIRLSKELRSFFCCENSTPFQYVNPKDTMPAEAKYWSYKNDDRMYNFYCDGKAIFIKKKKLAEYMLANTSLLLVAQIDIHYSDAYEYYGEKAKEAERRKVFVIDHSLNNQVAEFEIDIEHW